MTQPQAEPLAFADARALRRWLTDHHSTHRELWVRIYKVASGRPSVTWSDCVVEAICYGWIDGLKRALDDDSFLQRLTPRKPGSTWSARNREIVNRLIADGLMTPAGLAHVDAARADGR